MSNEKINATVENASAIEIAPTEKKINLKKAEKKAVPVPAPVLAEIEAKKADITRKIDVLNIRIEECNLVNKDGERLNATNWGKNETSTGNDTVGGLLRKRLAEYKEGVQELKRDLKCLYFTLDPVLATLQESENEFAKSLVNACVDNMRNVAIIGVDDYYEKAIYASYKREPKEGIDEKIVEALKIFANAGVERIGVAQELLGVAIPLLAGVGYTFESITQPVTIEAQAIEGLDPVPACTYYSFKKA